MDVRIMHPHADRGLDLYETPACATEARIRVGDLPHYIWECAAGRGAIARVLRAASYQVFTSDIVRRDFPLDDEIDFLKANRAPPRTQMILSNPPFMHAAAFVERALELCPHVSMLCRLSFLESRRRAAILDTGMLASVHVFIERLPHLHRHNWVGPRAASSVPYCWLTWHRNHEGPTILDRISIHTDDEIHEHPQTRE
jgi:hypothetical protein